MAPERDYETPACVVCGAHPLERFLILFHGATHAPATKPKPLNRHSLIQLSAAISTIWPGRTGKDSPHAHGHPFPDVCAADSESPNYLIGKCLAIAERTAQTPPVSLRRRRRACHTHAQPLCELWYLGSFRVWLRILTQSLLNLPTAILGRMHRVSFDLRS